jgi:hypothetical protein
MQAVTTIGLDIAKSVFQVHGVDGRGQVVLCRQLKRPWNAQRAPTTIARATKPRIWFRQNSNGYFGDTFGLLLDLRSKPDRRSLFERRSSLDRLSSLVIAAFPFVTQNREGR